MLLLAPCQSAMRSGWPASAARTAAVTGATWVGSATSSSIWLTASGRAKNSCAASSGMKTWRLSYSGMPISNIATTRKPRCFGATLKSAPRACGKTRVSRSPSRSPIRPARRVPTTTVSSPPNSARLPRRMPRAMTRRARNSSGAMPRTKPPPAPPASPVSSTWPSTVGEACSMPGRPRSRAARAS